LCGFPLFARLGIRHAPKETRLVALLLALKLFIGDEVHVSAEAEDVRSFLVPPANAFLLVRVLGGVEARIRSPGATKILDVRFPHRVGGGIEGAEFVRFAGGEPSK